MDAGLRLQNNESKKKIVAGICHVLSPKLFI